MAPVDDGQEALMLRGDETWYGVMRLKPGGWSGRGFVATDDLSDLRPLIVDVLRQAADKARGYIADATRPPWYWRGVASNRADIYHRMDNGDTVGIASGVVPADAHHMAAWHPGVTVHLADAWEALADYLPNRVPFDAVDRALLAAARAYIGEEQET